MYTTSKILAASLVALLLTNGVSAQVGSASKTGAVTKVVTHLDTWQDTTNLNQEVITHIYVAGLPSPNTGTEGCVSSGGYPRVSVSKSNPAYNSIVATALTAKASGDPVLVNYVKRCSVRSNSWDLGVIELK